MSYYSKEEQETSYNYDVCEGIWFIYSTYPPHIRQLLARATIYEKEFDNEGRIISVRGQVERNQLRLFMPLKKEA